MSTTNNRLTAEELQKLRQTDFSKKQGFVKAETVLAKEVGEVGTLHRTRLFAKFRPRQPLWRVPFRPSQIPVFC